MPKFLGVNPRRFGLVQSPVGNKMASTGCMTRAKATGFEGPRTEQKVFSEEE